MLRKKTWLSAVFVGGVAIVVYGAAQHNVSGGTDGCPSPGVDTDADGVCDPDDNCPDLANNNQADADRDGAGDACDLECTLSDISDNVVIDACDSGVENQTLVGGCTMADEIASCADGARNHGQFVRCVNRFVNEWKRAGLISGFQKGRISRCAGQANIPPEKTEP